MKNYSEPKYSRPYFVEMPSLTKSLASYFDYSERGHIAQTIPLFYVPEYKHFDECIGYIKRAFYLAKEFLEFTDMREQGVSLYIVASEPLKPFIEKYREDCAFPSENILWTPDYSKTFRNTAHKIPMLWHPELHQYEKILHSDTACLWWNLSEQSKYPLFKKISGRWQSESFFFIGGSFSQENNGESQFYKRTHPRKYEEIAELMGNTAEEAEKYWHAYKGLSVRGAYYGLTTDLIENFRQEMERIVKVIADDELAYTFYIDQNTVPFSLGQDIFPSVDVRDFVEGKKRKNHPVVSICPGCFPKGNYDKNRFFFEPFMDYCGSVNE